MISKQTDEAEALAREAKAMRTGRQFDTRRLGAEVCTATFGRTKSEDHRLMERVVERSNLRLAYQRVRPEQRRTGRGSGDGGRV